MDALLLPAMFEAPEAPAGPCPLAPAAPPAPIFLFLMDFPLKKCPAPVVLAVVDCAPPWSSWLGPGALGPLGPASGLKFEDKFC